MSCGGNVEGYLLHVDEPNGDARIVYCILDEGILQYYTHRGGPLLGVLALTGCKIGVYLLPDEEEAPRGVWPGKRKVNHQFRIESIARTGTTAGGGRAVAGAAPPPAPTQPPLRRGSAVAAARQAAAQQQALTQQRVRSTLTLAGATGDVAYRWALSILNWTRYTWGDPVRLCSCIDERAALQTLLDNRTAPPPTTAATATSKTTTTTTTGRASATMRVNPAVQPL